MIEQDFLKRYFPEAGEEDWNDWHWQLRNRIRSLSDLERIFSLTDDERSAMQKSGGSLPLGITPYYASLMDLENACSPLRRTMIPVGAEFVRSPGEYVDPLGEDDHRPLDCIVHTYPDKVLFLATDFCATYCRYCTRSRMVGAGELPPDRSKWMAALRYIEQHPEVRDVLISGGDPLTLSDERLDWLLKRLHEIPHVEFIRIGTKMPVVLPQRITESLVEILKKYHPLWFSIHVIHPDECTSEMEQACSRLANAGIPMGSQTVLMAGINDETETMKKLMQGLLRFRVKPYYLHQCDPVVGSAHFKTPVKKGLEIMRGLHGYTTGFAVPMYMIDAPGGGGKVPVTPDYLKGREGDDLILENYKGERYTYHDPL